MVAQQHTSWPFCFAPWTVNEGNIRILHGDGGDGRAAGEIEIELRTPVELFRDIDSFLAPSAQPGRAEEAAPPQPAPAQRAEPAERAANVVRAPTDSPAAKAPRRALARRRAAGGPGKENGGP